MAQQLELLLKAKNLTGAAFKAVEKHIQDVASQTKKTEITLKGARKSITDFANTDVSSALRTVGKGLGLITAAAAGAAAGLTILAKRGSEVAQIRQSFDALSNAIGQSGEAMLSVTREASKGLINDLDLMAASNKAMLLGLPVTTESMGTMAEAAVVLGRAMGQSATKSLDDLTTALGRSSPLILDNLGLTVKVGEANEAYARELGKTAKELTDAEKKMAFYNAAMDAAKAKVAEIGEIQLTFGEHLTIAGTKLQNLIDSIGELIATSPALRGLMEGVSDLLTTLTSRVQNNEDAIRDLIKRGILGFVGALESAVDAAQLAVDTFDALRLTWKSLYNQLLILAHAGESLGGKFYQLFGTKEDIAASKEKIALIEAEIDANARSVNDLLEGNRQKTNAIQEVKGALEGMIKTIEEGADSGVGMATAITDGLKETGEAAQMTAAEIEKLRKEQERAAKLAAEARVRAYKLEIDAAKQAMAENDNMRTMAEENLARIAASFDWPQRETVKWSEALEDVANQFQGIGGIAGDVLGALAQGIAGIGASIDRIKNSTATGLAGFFEKLSGGLGLIGSAFSIGTTIGNFIGGLFRDEEVEQVNDMRDAFLDLHGGWLQLQQDLAKITSEDLVKKVFDARTVEEFNAAVAEVNAALNLQGEAEAALQDAIDRYGFSIEELGPKWKQQELDKMAGQLLKDYELLVASGIDVNTVISKMGPNLQEYVNTALAAGSAIPESMRPIIEKMIEMGLLTDANGNAFESVEESGIQFTESLTDGLSRVIESIEKLVAALTGIPPVNIPVNYVPPGPVPEYPVPPKYPQAAHGAVVLPFRPAQHGAVVSARPGGELIRMGEAGDSELAAPVDAILRRMQATAVAAAAAGGGGDQRIVLELDGRVLSEVVTRRNRAGLLPVRESSLRRF